MYFKIIQKILFKIFNLLSELSMDLSNFKGNSDSFRMYLNKKKFMSYNQIKNRIELSLYIYQINLLESYKTYSNQIIFISFFF